MSVVSTAVTPGRGSTLDPDHPWPGLSAFEEGDQAFFVGRDDELETLHRLVRRQRLTVLFGQSGLGKTSLLQAGLFPRLREQDQLPIRILLSFDDASEPLTSQVRRAIVDAATLAAVQSPILAEAVGTLWEAFHVREADFWSARNRLVLPVLVFDQFEEIFTLGREHRERAQERRELLVQIADLIEGRPPADLRRRIGESPDQATRFDFDRHKYKVVISLREDYLADLDGLRRLIPSLAGDRLRIRPLTGQQALTIVAEPGRKLLDRETAEAVVRFAAGLKRRPEDELGAGAAEADGAADVTALEQLRLDPSLLSLFCRELNDRRRSERISVELIQAAGTQILSDFYEASLGDQSPACRTFIEDSLLTTSGHRDSVAFERAIEILGGEKAIGALVTRRLLRLEERGGERRVELTHDVLAEVVRASRDQRRRREEQERHAAALHASEERVRTARRQLRRSRATVALLGVLFVAAVGALFWGWSKQTEAERARVQAVVALRIAEEARAGAVLASEEKTKALTESEFDKAKALEAQAEADRARNRAVTALANAQRAGLAERTALTQAERAESKTVTVQAASDLTDSRRESEDGKVAEALAYLARALRRDPGNASARSWAFDYLAAVPLRLLDLQHGGLTAAALSEDGLRVVTASADGTARIWDAQNGRAVGATPPHQGRVTTVAFSADGTRVLTVSTRDGVQVWDATTGAPIGPPPRAGGPVVGVTFSPDGTRVLTMWSDGTAQIWDAATGVLGPPLKTGALTRLTRVAAVSPDGTRIVTSSANGTAQIWDAETGQVIGLTLPAGVTTQGSSAAGQRPPALAAAAFSHDGTRVVTASTSGTVQIWDVGTGRAIIISTMPNSVRSVRFSPDGTRVLTVAGSEAWIWEAGTRRSVNFTAQTARVLTATFSPDGLRIVTTSENGTAQIWDAGTLETVGMPLRHQGVVRASFGAKGALVMTASADGTRIWDARTGRAAGALLTQQEVVRTAAPSQAIEGTSILATSPAIFTEDGTRVMWTTGGTARIWEASTGRVRNLPLQREGTAGPSASAFIRTRVLFDGGGTRILTVRGDGTARVWNALTGETMGANLPHQGNVRAAALSADGSLVLTSPDRRTLTVWDVKTGQAVSSLLEPVTPVLSASFSQDGSSIVTTSTKTVQVWEARTGRHVADLSHPQVTAAFLNPDGSRLVSVSSDGVVQVWNADTSEALAVISASRPLTAFSFNASGTRVVTALSDRNAQVWESQTGRPVGRPVPHDGPVTTAAFSADGTRVVTASQTTAKIWDTQTGLEIHARLPHQGQALAAVFSADGTRVLTASSDGTARVWDAQVGTTADSAPLADLAEALGGLRLTETDTFEPIENLNDRLATLRQRAAGAELGQPGAASLMRWFFEDPWSRPLSPLSKTTVVEHIARMLAMGERGRREAERAFPGHPSLKIDRP